MTVEKVKETLVNDLINELGRLGLTDLLLEKLVNKVGLDKVSKINVGGDSFSRRLTLISEDVNDIKDKIMSNNLISTEDYDNFTTLFNNIDYTIDLNDDECLGWKTNSENELEKKLKIEAELKSNIYSAMHKLNEYWGESDVTYSLGDGYPFNNCFDELIYKVKEWSENKTNKN